MENITAIEIPRAESNLVDEPKKFDTLDEANLFLTRIAMSNRGTGGGYCKTDFVATFADGETYEGRFDLHAIDDKQETSNGAICLLRHMQDYIEFLAGERKPDHMTEATYADFIDDSAEVREWFDRLGCQTKIRRENARWI